MPTSSNVPSWKEDFAKRNLDEFYEEAYDFFYRDRQNNNLRSFSSYQYYHDLFRARSHYWLIFFSMGLANIADSTELGCMGFLLTSPEFIQDMLGGDVSSHGAMFTGSIFAGMLVGGILTGAFGDQKGRRPTLLLGLGLNSISGFCAAISPTILFLCMCRFAGGLGIGAILSSLIPLATEISPSSQRGAYVTVINAFMPIGGLTVGGLAMFMLTKWDLSWRLFVGACSIPSFLGFLLVYWYVPESARYLALEGNFTQATNEANYVAKSMGFHGTWLTPEELKHHFGHELEINDSSTKQHVKTLTLMIQEAISGLGNLYSSELRTSTFALKLLWFCLGSGSSFGTWILAIFEQLQIQHVYFTLFLFWLANVPGLLAAGILIDKIGRKKVLGGSLACTAISLCFFSRAAFIGAENSEMYIIITSFIFHAFLVMSWTANGILTSESFPTKIRTTGLGVCTASSRIATILAQFVNSSLIQNPSKLILISSVPIGIGLCALYFLEDTTNQSLKDDLDQAIELSQFSRSNSQNNNNGKQDEDVGDRSNSFVLLDGSSSVKLV